jgi:predicted enzyme related to lactoylglutathione lyase
MPNPFCYLQLQTKDHAEAQRFYKAMFDWTFSDIPKEGPPYIEVKPGQGVSAGIMGGSASAHWLAFVEVDDLAASTERAQELGATVAVPPTPVPGKGEYSIIIDPGGARLALWRSAMA